MAMSKAWFKANTEEIVKITVNCRKLNKGKVVVVQGDKSKEINLLSREKSELKMVTRNLICYEDLKNAETIEQRISIILDAVRDFDFPFYFDYSVTKMIFNK